MKYMKESYKTSEHGTYHYQSNWMCYCIKYKNTIATIVKSQMTVPTYVRAVYVIVHDEITVARE